MDTRKVAVFGMGGSGGRIANDIHSLHSKVDFFAFDTDGEALASLQIETFLLELIGEQKEQMRNIAKNGQSVMFQKQDRLSDIISRYDVIYLVSGMGGLAGTGATIQLSKLIKEHGKDCAAIVSQPFCFEGRVRRRTSSNGTYQVQKVVDICYIVECQNLHRIPAFKDYPLRESFEVVDRIMQLIVHGCLSAQYQGVKHWSTAKLDDMCTLLGVGFANKNTSIQEAIHQAIHVYPEEDNILSNAAQTYLYLSGSIDQRDTCIEHVQELMPPHTELIYSFDRRESTETNDIIVVASITKVIPKEREPPTLYVPPPQKVGAGGSRHHGLGGSFSTHKFRPRLWKATLQTAKKSPKPTQESSDDTSQQ